jgi:hypothetical protein
MFAKLLPSQSTSNLHLHQVLLLLKELGDGSLLGVWLCLGLPASVKGVVAADAGVPRAVLVGPPAAGQLPPALLPDASAAIWAGDLGLSGWPCPAPLVLPTAFWLPTLAADMRPEGVPGATHTIEKGIAD